MLFLEDKAWEHSNSVSPIMVGDLKSSLCAIFCKIQFFDSFPTILLVRQIQLSLQIILFLDRNICALYVEIELVANITEFIGNPL
jgi:hypothetical protein